VQSRSKQLRAAFERARLTRDQPGRQKFDPHRHQAISTVPISSDDAALAPNQWWRCCKRLMIADRVLGQRWSPSPQALERARPTPAYV